MRAHLELEIPAFSDRGIPGDQVVTRLLTPEGRYLNQTVLGFTFEVSRPLARVELLDGQDITLASLDELGAVGFPGQYVLRLWHPLSPLRGSDRYSLRYRTAPHTFNNVTCRLIVLPPETPL